MKNTPNNAKNILQDMKKITMLTGEISNIHEKSLLTWPYIVFDNIKNVEIKYDLTKSSKLDLGYNLVEFFIFTSDDSKQNIDNFEKRCETLKQWTEDMFWSEIKVRVYTDGFLEYSSTPEV
jgi:hypothetical protein